MFGSASFAQKMRRGSVRVWLPRSESGCARRIEGADRRGSQESNWTRLW